MQAHAIIVRLMHFSRHPKVMAESLMRVNVAPSLLYDRKIFGRQPSVEATFQVLIVHVDKWVCGYM